MTRQKHRHRLRLRLPLLLSSVWLFTMFATLLYSRDLQSAESPLTSRFHSETMRQFTQARKRKVPSRVFDELQGDGSSRFDFSHMGNATKGKASWDRREFQRVGQQDNKTVVANYVESWLDQIRALGEAKDENGKSGYWQDPTLVRRLWGSPESSEFDFDVIPYGYVCAPPTMGPEGPLGYRVLTERIHIRKNTIATHNNNARIFCAIYSHEAARDQQRGILQTWGKRCDGFMIASTHTDPNTGAIHIPHGSEGGYFTIWQKVRAMLAHIYMHHRTSYDYFHICGDDAYVIIENLKAFVSSPEVQRHCGGEGCPNPLYAGHWVFERGNLSNKRKLGADEFYYLGGGSGYSLSRSALDLFVEKALLSCKPDEQASYEDLLMGYCMKQLGLLGYNAQDESGADRYFGHDPEFAAKWRASTTSKLGRWWGNQRTMLQKRLNYTIHNGMDSVSPSAVAFHLIKSPAKMKRIEKLLYRRGVKDCSCDATHEPGVIMEPASTKGHPCGWKDKEGTYKECPSFYNEMLEIEAPKCS